LFNIRPPIKAVIKCYTKIPEAAANVPYPLNIPQSIGLISGEIGPMDSLFLFFLPLVIVNSDSTPIIFFTLLNRIYQWYNLVPLPPSVRKEFKGTLPKARGDTMAIDPVCKMEVDEKKAQWKTEYKGKSYYFCAPGCKIAFEENPQKYV
jgi:YHS domain-containing protein